MSQYPVDSGERDRFILSRRPARSLHDPWLHQGVLVEEERAPDGTIELVTTIFLTGSECPWKCVMCDLWKHTTTSPTPVGAIPHQILRAFDELAVRQPLDRRPPRTLKLYNAGSFFDPRAVPEDDYDAIAMAVHGVERLIVECHPALIGPRVDRFMEALAAPAPGSVQRPTLEVAMGLETAHPDALGCLHKKFTLEDFRRAAKELRARSIDIRVFLLISPPFVSCDEQDEWLRRSVAFAIDCDAGAISLIPTRSGNGALEALGDAVFTPPTLTGVERSIVIALQEAHRSPTRVIVDLWDIVSLPACSDCREARIARLHAMNLHQVVAPRIQCANHHEP